MVDFDLPCPAPDGANTFAAGICFLTQDPVKRAAARDRVEAIAADEGIDVLGWRAVPVDPDGARDRPDRTGLYAVHGAVLRRRPERDGVRPSGLALDRLVYPLRKRAGHVTPDVGAAGTGVYFASLSSRTMTYKGMLTAPQMSHFFPDLRDERCKSAIAIVHSRFSTNTFPSWPLAHPFRFVAHNGEINTVRGNRNRMHAREAMLSSPNIRGDLSRLVADLHTGGVGLGVVRSDARTVAPEWSQSCCTR